MSIDRKIDYVNQDGYKNYIKNSKSVTVPLKFKSKKDATPTKLAYITADEAKMLKKMKKNTPHKGPSGIPSYDDYDASKGDYGSVTSGEQMSGFETGAKGERSRADARSLGMSPQDVQDIRGGALRAGAGRTVNPGLFGNPNRPGVNVNRGGFGNFGRNIFSGILGLINPALGFLSKGFGFIGDKLQDLRGYDEFGNPLSQEEYEKAQQQKSLQSRLDNLYDRKNRGLNFSQKNINMLEAMGLQPSTAQNVLTGRDLKGFTESRMGLTDPDVIEKFANPIAPMGVNVPSTGIETIDVSLPGNDLMAEITQADIDRFKQPMTQIMDYDTYKSINTDSTLTEQEFNQLKAQV